MIKSNIGFALFFFFVFSISCGQTQKASYNGAYYVDNRVKEQVESKLTTLGGMPMGGMDFKMFEDGNLTVDSYSKGKPIECMNLATLEGDTVNITGFAGMFAGFGFQITLFRDTCIVRHFAKSDAEMYKLNRSDSLTLGVSVPCKTYKLVLTKKPEFKKGEIIEGIIELTSDEYFEVSNGSEKKDKIQLTGYFKTNPLQADR